MPKEKFGRLCIPRQNMAINLFGLMEFNGMKIIVLTINVLKKISRVFYHDVIGVRR